MLCRVGALMAQGGRRASPNPASLDLNFMAGVLPGGVTLTRAGSATYTDVNGLLATASSNVARFDYDPSSVGTLLGLLCENAATNLLLHSNFASGWTFTSASFAQGAATGPDGVAGSAVKLVEAAATAQHFATISAITIVAGSIVTGSFWAKQGERTTATLRLSNGSVANGCSAFLNLATGAITSSAAIGSGTILGATATNYPSLGYTRYTVTGTIDPATATTARLNIFLQNATYAGDGTSGIFCFGAQAEAGALATSYTPTTTASVTRAADVMSFTVPTGIGNLVYTFDDDSTQTVAVSPGAYTVPTNLNRPRIKRILGTM